jgi:hypothetical protein
MVTVTSDEVKQIIRQELPNAIATDPAIGDFILQTVSRYYATRTEMDDKFDRILGELQRDREEGDMYLFERKVEFYAQHQNRRVNRKLVISPMVDVNALPVAQLLGIEVYSYAQDVSDR